MSFPDLAAKQQISRDGGYRPKWSRDGQEVFFFDRFIQSSGRMMRARRATSGGTIAWQEPTALFEVSRVWDFDLAPDGTSFYFAAPNPDAPARELNVVVNWVQETLADTAPQR